MSRLSLLRPLFVAAIFGCVFLFALVEQISDRANPEQQHSSGRLTRAQVTDMIGMISEICDRIDLGADLQRSQFTEAQFANANMLVSDTCNQVGLQQEQAPAQPAGAKPGETGLGANFPLHHGV